MEKEGSFSDFLWQFVGGSPIQNEWLTMADVPTSTPESRAMSKALKKRGFSFVGETIAYAFMQATGFCNDHLVTCFRHRETTSASRHWRGNPRATSAAAWRGRRRYGSGRDG